MVSAYIPAVRVVLGLTLWLSCLAGAEPKRACGGLPSDSFRLDSSPTRLTLVSAAGSAYLLYDTGKSDPYLQFFQAPQVPRGCGDPTTPVVAQTVPRSLAAHSVAGGDFNGDGIPDAVSIAVGPNLVSVFLGDAAGTLKAGASYSLGTKLAQVAAADVNGDRRLDLVVVDTGTGPENPGAVYVLLGNGDGTFRALPKRIIGDMPVSVAIADFDRDGKPDLAVADALFSTVWILIGKGDGTFPSASGEYVDEGPGTILTADFNGDGRADLAVTSTFSSSVSILLGSGDGRFLPYISSNTGSDPGFLASGDFNGDGNLDLAILFESTNTISIYLGRGTGFFGLPASYVAGGKPKTLALADLDGDGLVDILTPDADSRSLLILFGKRDGTFDAPPLYPVGLLPRAIAMADFNGDGKTDLVTANEGSNDISILLGSGDGAFRPLPRVSLLDPLTFPRPVSIAVGDFNRDGVVDIATAAAAPTNQVTILLGKGNATFQPPKGYATGLDPQFVLAADFNGDGILDLATANGNRDSKSNFGGVSILLGNGDGTFRAPVNYNAGVRPYAIVAADFNGDGRLDLAVGASGDIPSKQPETVTILLGRGDGGFDLGSVVSIGNDPPNSSTLGALAVGDINNDGKLDLVVTASGVGSSSAIAVLTGAGDGTFQVASYPAGPGIRSVAIADIDGDGRLDVVTAHCCGAGGMGYLLGQPDGALQPDQPNGTLQPEAPFPGGAAPIGIVINDFNGDGKADLAVVNSLSSGTVAILLNRLPAPAAVLPPATTLDPVAP